MQIVIDIDEEDYKRIQDTSDVFNSLTSRSYSAIRNGTPLPKGHGRLIDADELIEGKVANDWTRIQAECANTIIEADKAESEEV